MGDAKKTCFVVMGFGQKPDFRTSRVLDLDKTYRHIIKPAAEAAPMGVDLEGVPVAAGALEEGEGGSTSLQNGKEHVSGQRVTLVAIVGHRLSLHVLA